MGGGLDDGKPVGPGDHRHEHHGESDPQRPRDLQACDQQKEGRVDDVELLLDRERPVVLERRGRPQGGQVVGADRLEVEVRQEDGRPPPVVGRVIAEDEAEEDVGGHDDDHNDQGRRGKDPSAPTRVEADDRRPTGALSFAQQQPGDHEAGDDEEDVDPDVAAGEAGYAGVVEDHQQRPRQRGAPRRPAGSGGRLARCRLRRRTRGSGSLPPRSAARRPLPSVPRNHSPLMSAAAPS